MRNLQVQWALLVLLLLAMGVSLARANFHVVVYHITTEVSFDGQVLVPSSNFGCNGVQHPQIAPGAYPDCNGPWLHIPDGQCGWSGVTIRPACTGNYFGKLYGGSGEPESDCYWNDAHDTPSFSCSISSSAGAQSFDRLVCYTSMCGS
ncbi:hypothetical protein O6H91_02G061900 [Diphasiastrum complanatum]|uniref:Uncharacterized protein n=1 Tax=Diphasiastrum complanatum TaxID=34168 RepID=A0ACC2EG41_DIPCM|nr:hypothetical protein O6H91_02G061900 [Diphasiastrum complanatum]